MNESGIYLYVSEDGSQRISVLRMTPDSGELTQIHEVPVTGKVMPMAVSPNRRFLYAALRSKPYSIANFSIDGLTGMLTHLGYTPVSDSMVNVTTDRTGRFFFGAINPPDESSQSDRYHARRTGQISLSAIGDSGFIQSPYELFRVPPKLHAVSPDPSNRFIFGTCCDADIIVRYTFDATTGLMNPDPLPPVMTKRKAGPRHFKFHPNNRFMYLVNEYDATVYTFKYDVRNGSLSELQIVSALPPEFQEPIGRAADLHFTPDGKWLYVSVRNSLSIAAFSVDASTGLLTLLGHFPTAKEPRSFCIDPFGRFLIAVAKNSNILVSFRINPETGALTKFGEFPTGKGPNWIECVRLP